MVALRYVMEALKKPPNNKDVPVFRDGSEPIPRAPPAHEAVLRVQDATASDSEYIEHGVRSQEPPAERSGGMASPLPVAQPAVQPAQPSDDDSDNGDGHDDNDHQQQHGVIERPHRPARHQGTSALYM